ncbi:MAG: helix-turn-helix transcriptional regulator [Planctomycetes bacterium]|nr:helix-turn-helix transcriptional regulator [Planctomycetota bacterium]
MSTTRRTQLDELDACPCAGKNLDRFIQPAVLAILADGPIHGYRIVQSLARLPAFKGRRPDAAGVYRFLKAMKDRGLVTSAWDLSEGGPARRLFDLSPKGRACLVRWADVLAEYQKQIGLMVKLLKKTLGGFSRRPCGCRNSKRRKPASAAPANRGKKD